MEGFEEKNKQKSSLSQEIKALYDFGRVIRNYQLRNGRYLKNQEIEDLAYRVLRELD